MQIIKLQAIDKMNTIRKKECKFTQCNCSNKTGKWQDFLYFLSGIYHTGKHYMNMRDKYHRQLEEMKEIRRHLKNLDNKYRSMFISRDKWKYRAIKNGYKPKQEDHHNGMYLDESYDVDVFLDEVYHTTWLVDKCEDGE